MKETKIALGTWAMGAGLNLWDTATAYGMGESERILGHLASTPEAIGSTRWNKR